ncbi:non-canonical purine NTP pyrophosphatase [Priestia megaterium]|uniref:non-canonical purine NTP pyrophosphatase n=1 Tax=Priestia megaterium TaxID=1404 RepID=UPI000BFDA518|nr:non-canonical purine NTP pyrophosphatase [Priestia megaterium]PGX34585.1 non-canonical purine NTP pyrophosphatase [Priestia megaterium]
MQIRFLSGNSHKIKEASEILNQVGFDVVPVTKKIEEIQTDDSTKLIRDKTIKAFREIGRPLFVEHTGLYLNYINGLPGGLTQVFWDNLEADKFCEIFGDKADTSAVAKTIIGYIDGKRIHIFEGEINGKISNEPLGNREFQWDCVFIPEGFDKTFSELGEEKNEISMRRKALDEFATFLKEN